MNEPALQLTGLQKDYRGQPVLRGIDLEVPRGQVIAYLGPNGAGKSTTVRILVGMLPDFEGNAKVCGIDVRLDPLAVKRRIGFVPEQPALYESLTVREHLLLVGRVHGLPDELTLERGLAMLDAFGLGSRDSVAIGSLSKGMRQKVVFTAALLHDPEVLFLDEPLSGLDVHAAAVVKELLRGLAAAGKTVFYCSHVLDVVEKVCDRIVVLHDGRLLVDDDIAGLRRRVASDAGSSLEQIFLGLVAGGDAPERAQQLLAALGAHKARAL